MTASERNRLWYFSWLVAIFCLLGRISAAGSTDYPWLERDDPRHSLIRRIAPPPGGFFRPDLAGDDFGRWLRELPLKPDGWPVHLFDGRLKRRQDIHHAVVDIDVGRQDLQQCADAIIRLRAEYLWTRGLLDRIRFDFLNGFTASYPRWRDGFRYRVRGSRVEEFRSEQLDAGYRCFREYLQQVFAYANTTSLRRQMAAPPGGAAAEVESGDAFISVPGGGGIGHAVLVVDVAIDGRGRKRFLLLQSFMPAQEIHILKNPGNADGSPWYDADFGAVLITPEWTFSPADRRRFR